MKARIGVNQIKEIVAFVEKHGRDRQKVQGSRFNDVDFSMGAATVFYALGIETHLPVKWIFNPMSNQPIFKNENESKKESNTRNAGRIKR